MIKIELTESERDVLYKAYENWVALDSAAYTAIGLKLHPKKESVEFDMSDLTGQRGDYFRVQICSERILISDSIRRNTVEFDRRDFEKLIKLYEIKKHEVADE